MKKILAVVVAVIMLAAMILPATVSAYETPAELTSASANEIGVWPMDAGMYDPSLDGKGLINGVHVYGCYDFDFTTFVITPKTVPTDLAGYTKVDAPADMTDGTWCVLTITGAPDYSYVLVMGEPQAAAAPEPVAEPEPVVEPDPVVEPAPITEPEPVAEPDPVSEPAPVASATPISTPATPAATSVPRTADTGSFIAWALVGAVALAAAAFAVKAKKA